MLYATITHLKYGTIKHQEIENYQSIEQMTVSKDNLREWIKASKKAPYKHEIEAVYSDGEIIIGKIDA